MGRFLRGRLIAVEDPGESQGRDHPRPFLLPLAVARIRWSCGGATLDHSDVQRWEVASDQGESQRNWEKEIYKILEESVNAKLGSIVRVPLDGDRSEYAAAHYLADIGAFEQRGTGSFRLTAYGRDYWEKLNAPRWYWFRQNWFAASVAGATIVAASVSAAANIVNLLV